MSAIPSIPGWIIERELGRGADATVWLARPAAGGEAVALKTIPLIRLRDPAAHLREAWAAGSTGSRFVIAVTDAGQYGEYAWLAMEPASGDAAALATRAGGRLKPASAARIARDAARGLQALSDHGYVHKDIKPSNILLRPDGTAMLGDLAPLRGGGTATRSADLSGTPAYLSPEQVLGRPPDARSDVHALGATLFALIAGHPPFAADGALELLRAIAEQPAPDLRTLVPDVPPAIAEVVATALSKDPAQRQQRGAQLADELEAALAGRQPVRVATPAAVPAAPVSWPAWLPWAAAGVALILGLALGAGLAGSGSGGGVAEERRAEASARERRMQDLEQARTAMLASLRGRAEQLRRERDRLQLAQRTPAVPAVSAATPAASGQRPAASDQQPAASDQRPAASGQQPAASGQQPAASGQQPAASSQQPATSGQQPAPTTQQPAAITQQPIAPPPAVSPLSSWTISWDLPWPEPEAPANGSSTDVLTAPLQAASGLSWSRCDSGVLLVWDISAVQQSTNGGFAWRQAWSGPSPEGSYTSPGAVASWGARTVLLPTGQQGLGLLSQDGGRSFRPLGRPGLAGVDLDDVNRPGRRIVLADGSCAILAGARVGSVVLTSADGGRSWRQACASTGSLNQIVPQAEGFGLLFGQQVMSFARAPDAQHERLGRNSGYAMASFAYGGAMHLLLSDGTLARISTRDGLQLAQLTLPGRSPVGLVIDPRDARHILIADADLGLLRSTDGGATWQGYIRRFAFGRITAIDLAGRKRPRLAVLTTQSVLLLDFDHLIDEQFRPLRQPDEAVLQRIDLPGQRSAGEVGLGVRGADPKAVVAWSYDQAWTSQDGGTNWTRTSFESTSFPDVAAIPTWDGKGLRLVLPLSDNLALLGDMATGTMTPLPPPWGNAANARYAIPAALRADGLLVTGWASADARPGDGKALHLCSTRDGGRSWAEERRIGMRAWQVADPDLPLLVGAGYDGLWISSDYGRSERAVDPASRSSSSQPLWCLAARQLWAIDSEWTRLLVFDTVTQRMRSQPIRPPAAAMGSSDRTMAVDPRDPRRIWVNDPRYGLIHSPDGGRTWAMADAGLEVASSQIRYLDGDKPALMVGGSGCIWRIDAGAAGAKLFDRPCAVIP